MPVLDASVYIAYLSPAESHHPAACDLFDSLPVEERLVVPRIFGLEVIAALSRRGEARPFLDAVDALTRSPKFERVDVDQDLIDRAIEVSRRGKLRAYEALYAAVALERGIALWTLDDDVVRRLRKSLAQLEVVSARPSVRVR